MATVSLTLKSSSRPTRTREIRRVTVRGRFSLESGLASWKRQGDSLTLGVGLVLLVAAALVPTSFAADKSGVSPNTISLPKGPGSIEGLGEAFQPTLNTGTAKYSIGFKLPPGTAGQAPSLGLSYEGGGANGPLGFGWTLSLPSIQRRTDHGIPTYGQDVGFARQDTFINEMKEELVPQTNGFLFCQNEGAFIRYQPVGDHWEGTLPNGTRMKFGLSEQARIQNGTNGQVFSWLLEQEIDTHGNTILYGYSSFGGDANQNQKYLSTIRYGPGAPPWSSYHFVSLDYEDRPDWFEDCRSGFIVRTGKRLKTVRVGTQGLPLAGHLQGDFDGDGTPDYLDRAYQLEYLSYAGTNSHWSLLAKVTLVGADGVSTLPSLTFGYALSDPPDTLSAAGHIIGGTNEPPVVMDNTLVELIDLNGDGLPDILKTDSSGGAHQAFLNRGEIQSPVGSLIQWDSPIDVDPTGGTAWSYSLSAADTHLADMDGDGLADLVHKTVLGDVIYFPNLGRGAWGQQQMMAVQDTAPPSPFGEADVRTADLDFDKRMDIIQSVASGVGFAYRIWFNLGNQTYSPAITVDQDNGFSLADPAVQIVDLNGDRLADVARIQPTGVSVTAGLGYGRFAASLFMALPDEVLDDTQVSRAKLTDLNGDGLADLVIERAAPGECWYWLNLGNYSWSTRKVITGLPTTIGQNAVVRWADLNGNGSSDLVYADQSSSPRIQTVDLVELLAGNSTPNVLTAISNGIGRVSLIEYQPSTAFALVDAAAGQPWTNLMPLVVQVVAGVTTLDSLGHSYVSRFQYHEGYYDPVEKQFRGFGRVEQIDVGDATAPTLVTRSYFDTGQQYEPMKGKLLRLTTLQDDGQVFSDATTTWTIPPVLLMVGTNGTNVSYAHPLAQTTQIEELGQGTPRTLQQEFSFDNYGNQTRLADYGIVEKGDRSAFHDERITTTEYAVNTDLWLLRFPARQKIQDLSGGVVSRIEHYYDDETFSGNNLGAVTVGNLTLTRAWIDPLSEPAYIASTRSKFDVYGNAIVLLDPLAKDSGGAADFTKGHAREIAYDPALHTYPIQETIHIGNGRGDLIFHGTNDAGFGTTTRSLDFNQNPTTCGYDAFGRLVQMIKPGDSADLPTIEYDYALGLPFGVGGIVNYIETRQLDRAPGTAGLNARDYYLIGRQFMDGLGRVLLAKQEAEPAPGGSTPRVVVSGAVLFNARMKPSHTLNPYFSRLASSNLDDLLAYESIEDPAWKGTFHQNGQLVDLTLGNAHQTSVNYDALLRTIRSINPDGTPTRTEFEPLITKAYDENDTDPTSPFYDTPLIHYQDGLGRLIRADELSHLNDDGTASGTVKTWTTSFTYDPRDLLTTITDSQNNIKTMAYDGLKRKTAMSDPDRGNVSFVYDDASNIKATLDAKEQQILYTYDGANRLLTEDYLDDNSPEFSYHRSPDVACFYDEPLPSVDNGDGTRSTARNTKGMLAYVVDTSGEEHNSYDERGRVEWTIKRIPDPLLQSSSTASPPLLSYRTQFDHDSMNRVTRMVYPDNDQVSYEYNSRGLLQRIAGGPAGSILSNIVYAPSGQQAQLDYGNGIRTTHGYDLRQRLAALITFRLPQPGNPLINFSYQFDAASNIRAIQDQRDLTAISATDKRRNSQAFAYDDLYRLTRAQYNLPASSADNGGEIDYRYDRIGNMLSQTSTIDQQDQDLPVADLGSMGYGGPLGPSNRGGRKPGDPPGPHALTSIHNSSISNSSRAFPYDANGNMTEIDNLHCTWDFKDRLVAVESDSMRAQYAYDYSGRRITKIVDHKPGTAENLTPASQRRVTLYVNSGFEIRDHDQPTKYLFDGPTRVASVIGSLSSNMRIQRLRCSAGWNLLSLAVSATNFVGQLHAASSLLGPIFAWSSATSNYTAVPQGQTVPAGAVLWIKSATNVSCSIIGVYTEPLPPHVEPGGTYVPGAGLTTWSLSPPPSVSTWRYEAQSGSWQETFAGGLASASDVPVILAPGQPVFINSPTAVDLEIPKPDLNIRFYHEDHLGSAAVITDSAGELVEETAFFPFGHPRSQDQPFLLDDPYQFTQKERDAESGLTYFGKRFYSPLIAKWLSADPMEEKGGGFNPYAYVNQNPIKFQDFDGGEIRDTHKGHVITIHLTAVLVNDSPLLAQRGYDLKGLAANIKGSIEHAYQGKFTGEYKGVQGTWTVHTVVDSIQVVDNWSQIQPGKKAPHVFHIVDRTYDGQAANARIGGMLITMGAPDLLMKKPTDLTEAELANPMNQSYAKGYQSGGTIGAHEYGHNGGLSHKNLDKKDKGFERENLMSEDRWNDSDKITSAQLGKIVEAVGAGNVNNPADVAEEKKNHK